MSEWENILKMHEGAIFHEKLFMFKKYVLSGKPAYTFNSKCWEVETGVYLLV